MQGVVGEDGFPLLPGMGDTITEAGSGFRRIAGMAQAKGQANLIDLFSRRPFRKLSQKVSTLAGPFFPFRLPLFYSFNEPN